MNLHAAASELCEHKCHCNAADQHHHTLRKLLLPVIAELLPACAILCLGKDAREKFGFGQQEKVQRDDIECLCAE